MAKSKNRAIWYLFTTMLSIFNICTIRIFDGFNWPFYAVTVNAVISLCGLIFHVHLNQRDQKRPLLIAVRILLLLNSISVFVMIGFSMFILNSQYHNPLRPDKVLSSPFMYRTARSCCGWLSSPGYQIKRTAHGQQGMLFTQRMISFHNAPFFFICPKRGRFTPRALPRIYACRREYLHISSAE